jgi:endo-1,4-beta-xylanase
VEKYMLRVKSAFTTLSLPMKGSREAPMSQPLSLLATRAGAALLLALATFVFPVAARAQVVHHDFEDGTTQGWVRRGTAMLTVTNEAAATGLHSLKATGRTAPWNGPGLDVMPTVQKELLYQFRVSVRLTAGQATLQDTLRMTIERRVAGETSDRFDSIAASPTNGVTSGSWVTLQGSYRLGSDVTKLILYVESVGATTEYYIDDFRITEVVPDQTGFVCDFETDRNNGLFCFTAQNGGDRNWTPLGTAALANVTEEAHGGTHSLRTTGRTAVWQGPALNILSKMTPGFRYRATVWAKLAAGEPDTNLRATVERRLAGVTSFHTVIPNTLVTAGQWVRMSALFTMPGDADFLSLKVETATAATASFYVDDLALSYAPPLPIQTDIPSLRDVLADFFTIGGAVDVSGISSGRHNDLMRKHLGTITAENSWKFAPIHPAEATYNFGPADSIANFARQNGLKMRGHTLVWHQQTPDWLFRDASGVDLTPTPENKELVLQRLESHIRTVVPRYADVVTSWDVVNEVIDPSQADGLRRSRWLELTGTDYIDRAFQVAREVAPPSVKLCINDYSTTETAKRQALLGLVQGMIARGVPVDCVGHQMHINVESPSVASIRTTIETFAALGLDNQMGAGRRQHVAEELPDHAAGPSAPVRRRAAGQTCLLGRGGSAAAPRVDPAAVRGERHDSGRWVAGRRLGDRGWYQLRRGGHVCRDLEGPVGRASSVRARQRQRSHVESGRSRRGVRGREQRQDRQLRVRRRGLCLPPVPRGQRARPLPDAGAGGRL